MKLKRRILKSWTTLAEDWRCAASAPTCALLGFCLLVIFMDSCHWFYRASYDWLLVAKTMLLPAQQIDDFLIISIDEESSKILGEDPLEKKDRTKYAQLANKLFGMSARLVVFDVLLDEEGAGDSRFAQAITNRNVVLVKSIRSVQYPGGPRQRVPSLPIDSLLSAAGGQVGEVDFEDDVDGAIRRHPAGTNSVPWVVARLLGEAPLNDWKRLWINYYGIPPSIPKKSYYQVLDTSFTNISLVRNKVVFVGRGGPHMTAHGDDSDQHLTPYDVKADGVEILATTTRNLLKHEGISEPSHTVEALVIIVWGTLFSLLLNGVRVGGYANLRGPKLANVPLLRRGLRIIACSVALIMLVAFLMFAYAHVWLPWTIPVFAQIPCAAAWTVWMVVVPPKPRYDAFISYRRSGGSDFVRLVHDKLENQENIKTFVDINELGAGKFGPELLGEIDAAPSFIFIVSSGAFDRCYEDDDWVRQEIAHALKLKKNIVPLMMEGCSMPKRKTLPDDIADFAELNGFEYSNSFADAAIHKLASELRS